MTTTAEASSIIKRRRLVDAAAELFHRQGVAPTTFANVASEAKIALGSVYYYFNAKDDLVAAVTEARKGGIEALLARLDGSKQPRQRLEGLIDAWVSDRLVDALYGCPVGSLCFEVAEAAARWVRWRHSRFRCSCHGVNDSSANSGQAEMPHRMPYILFQRFRVSASLPQSSPMRS